VKKPLKRKKGTAKLFVVRTDTGYLVFRAKPVQVTKTVRDYIHNDTNGWHYGDTQRTWWSDSADNDDQYDSGYLTELCDSGWRLAMGTTLRKGVIKELTVKVAL
jgi:hypothetical protein